MRSTIERVPQAVALRPLGTLLSARPSARAVLIALGLACAAAAAGRSSLVLLAPLLLPLGLVVLLRWPVAVFVAWLVAAGQGVAFNLPHALHVGTATLTPQEICGYALLSYGLLRWLTGRSAGRHPLNYLMGAFALAIVLGAIVGLERGSSRSDVIAVLKEAVLYFLVLAVAYEFRTVDRLRLLEIAVITVTAVLTADTVVQVALGTYQTAATHVTTLGETVDIDRINPELLNLVVLALFLLLPRLRDRRDLRWALPCLGVFLAILLLSFTRSTWIAIVLALAAWTVMSSREGAAFRLAAVVLIGALIGVPAYAAAAGGAFGQRGVVTAERIASIGSSSAEDEVSYTDRQTENAAARATLRSSPLLGTGVAQPYGAVLAQQDPLTDRTEYVDRPFIHNQFYRVWMWFGLLGAASVLAVGVWVGVACRHLRAEPGKEARDVGVAAAAGLIALAIQALFQTSFPKSAFIAAIVSALLLIRGWQQVARSSHAD